jgi:hypothetical protein
MGHHLLAWAAALLQVAFLLRGGAALAASERHLTAFAAAVETVRYTPRVGAPLGAPPAPVPTPPAEP